MTPAENREFLILMFLWSMMIIGPAIGFEWQRRREVEKEKTKNLIGR